MKHLPNKLRRKFGFSADNAGIMSRYLYEEENWNSHLQNTKEFILNNAADKQKDLCMILGSGWCLDIPLQELADMFKQLILVDIVHPRQILNKKKTMPGLEFMTLDISGCLELIYSRKKELQKTNDLIAKLRKVNKTLNLFDTNPDYVISANILSQLAYFPLQFIKKKHPRLSEKDAQLIQKQIEQNHSDLLPKGKTALITDYSADILSLSGQVREQKKRLAIDLAPEKIKKEWFWDLA